MKIRILFLSIMTSLLMMWSLPSSASAQRTLTGTNYVDGFESITGGSLPSGWSCRFNASASAVGDEILFDNGVATWRGASIGQPYDMASAHNTNPATSNPFNGSEDEATQNAAPDRAPGMRLSSGVDGDATWTLQIADTIGFSDFVVSMDLLVLSTNSRTGVWTVDYAVGNDPASFTPLGQLGDLPGSTFGATNSGALVLGPEANNQGQNLWIRLALLTKTGPSGARDTYGIDNFNLTYTGGVVDTSPPSINVPPQSQTSSAGDTAHFTVEAEGAPTLSFQWRKDGVALGAPSLTSLNLPEVVTADAGDYDVVIANSYGSITSAVATLTVVADPGLIGSSTSIATIPGDALRVTVDVAGTMPKRYQWLKDGAKIPEAIGELNNAVVNTVGYTVTTNAAAADEGAYSIVVSNSQGMVTGVVADVTVMTTPSTRLAAWNFNSLVNDGDDDTGVDTPFVGSGIFYIAPLTTSFEWRGGAPADVADLAVTNDNSAYRARGVNTDFNLESGVEVLVDTTGYQDIFVSWYENHNSRGSRYMRFQYSTNGFDFIDATGYSFAGQDGSWLLQTEDLFGIEGVEDNPDFAFRIVAEWESTAIDTTNDVYVAADPGSSFSAANGVMIFDQFTVWANPLGTAAPIALTDIGVSGGSVVVPFSSSPGDSPDDFKLLNAPAADGTYTDSGATISEPSPGNFVAETATGGSPEFYIISR